MSRSLLAAIACLWLPAAALATVEAELAVEVHAGLARVDGTVTYRISRDSPEPLDRAVLLLPRNEMRHPSPSLDDVSRPLRFPDLDFDPGGVAIRSVTRDGRRLDGPWDSDALVVAIPFDRPLSSDGTTTLTVAFETLVPARFGGFGRVGEQLTLSGGWFPALAAMRADGAWDATRFARVDLDVRLRLPVGHAAVLGDRFVAEDERGATHRFPRSLPVPLAVAPDFRRERHPVAGAPPIELVRRPRTLTTRIGPPPEPESRLPDALSRILRDAPLLAEREPLVVVETPSREELAIPAGGQVLVSDRALRVHELLWPFHERALAEAVHRELLGRRGPESLADPDRFWVEEGVAAVLAERFVDRAHPRSRSVDEWIRLFDVFAVVDRFERAPQIPFVDAFFAKSTRPPATPLDPSPSRVSGRIVFQKMENSFGREAVERMADTVVSGCAPFRRCAEEIVGRPVDAVVDPWIGPWPSVDHGVVDTELNVPSDEGYEHSITLERRATRAVVEPVPVRLEKCDGGSEQLWWNSVDDVDTLFARTESRVCRVLVDPDRTLIDENRHDNAAPPTWEFVLDTADVEVSSTEFGLAGLAVLRQTDDVRRDVGIAGFFSNRSVGTTWGPRFHFGEPLDRSLFANNLYLFGTVERLLSSFKDERFPDRRTGGITTGLGARFERTNVHAFDNPTRARRARLFVDWHSRDLGGDYDFLSGGAALSGTQPIGSRRTIGAVEVLNGFLTGSRVPNQGLFSLGGARSIRGIGAEEELGKHIFLVRTELRRELRTEIDASLFDGVVARGGQIRAFVDAGRVQDDVSRVYDVEEYAVGAGVGLTLLYEFFGFFPSRVYLDVATRADEGSPLSNVQFLFGTRQPF